MFHAYYDLAYSPPTYDIIDFLCEVERERLARGETEVGITFLPGPSGGFRADSFWPRTFTGRAAMLYRVAVPLCGLLPSVKWTMVATTRDGSEDGYGVGQGIYGLSMRTTAMRDGLRPLRARATVQRDPELLTITLREGEHWPSRNSKLDEWMGVAGQLDAMGWRVVVVRDTRFAAEPFGAFEIAPRASLEIEARAELYAQSALNIGISNGPMWLSMVMDAPTLLVKPTMEGLDRVFSGDFFASFGVNRGGQMPGAPTWQRLAWCEDTARSVVDAYETYAAENGLKAPIRANRTQVTVKPNTAVSDALANIRTNLKRSLMQLGTEEPHEGHAVLVGGGPSLEDSLWEIKRRRADGQFLFALNGAGKWLAARGVHPDYVVILDPRASNAAFVGPPCTYYLASQCAPEVFEEASRFDVGVWHFADPDLVEEIAKMVPTGTFVGGGLTVGITAMALVHMLGFRKMHLYGYDSSDADGAAHAYAQAEDAAEAKRVEVWCGGKKFVCQAAMYVQAQVFPDWASSLADQGSLITVHGDGLLPTIARSMSNAQPIQEDMAI